VISEASFAILFKYAVLIHHEELGLLGFWILFIVLYPEQQTVLETGYVGVRRYKGLETPEY
jgi:hypothetical protein